MKGREFTADTASHEWWTLAQVCVYLQIHRATLHRWRRDKAQGFPNGAHFSAGALRFSAAAIRCWADWRSAETIAAAANDSATGIASLAARTNN